MTLELEECATFSVLFGHVRKTSTHFTTNYIFTTHSKYCNVLSTTLHIFNMQTTVSHSFP